MTRSPAPPFSPTCGGSRPAAEAAVVARCLAALSPTIRKIAMSSASSHALRLLPLVALVASPLALAAEPLKVFSPRLADPEAPIYTTFTAETGIPVELVETSMEAFTDGMRAAAEEGATPPADVLMVVDSANIHRQREAGWFQPLASETLEARVPEALRDLEAEIGRASCRERGWMAVL